MGKKDPPTPVTAAETAPAKKKEKGSRSKKRDSKSDRANGEPLYATNSHHVGHARKDMWGYSMHPRLRALASFILNKNLIVALALIMGFLMFYSTFTGQSLLDQAMETRLSSEKAVLDTSLPIAPLSQGAVVNNTSLGETNNEAATAHASNTAENMPQGVNHDANAQLLPASGTEQVEGPRPVDLETIPNANVNANANFNASTPDNYASQGVLPHQLQQQQQQQQQQDMNPPVNAEQQAGMQSAHSGAETLSQQNMPGIGSVAADPVDPALAAGSNMNTVPVSYSNPGAENGISSAPYVAGSALTARSQPFLVPQSDQGMPVLPPPQDATSNVGQSTLDGSQTAGMQANGAAVPATLGIPGSQPPPVLSNLQAAYMPPGGIGAQSPPTAGVPLAPPYSQSQGVPPLMYPTALNQGMTPGYYPPGLVFNPQTGMYYNPTTGQQYQPAGAVPGYPGTTQKTDLTATGIQQGVPGQAAPMDPMHIGAQYPNMPSVSTGQYPGIPPAQNLNMQGGIYSAAQGIHADSAATTQYAARLPVSGEQQVTGADAALPIVAATLPPLPEGIHIDPVTGKVQIDPNAVLPTTLPASLAIYPPRAPRRAASDDAPDFVPGPSGVEREDSESLLGVAESAGGSSLSAGGHTSSKFQGVEVGTQGVLHGMNITKVSFMLFRIMKQYNLHHVLDYPCTSNLEWMPQFVKRMDFEMPGFLYSCVVSRNEEVEIVRLAFRESVLPDIYVRDPSMKTIEIPNCDLLFSWNGMQFMHIQSAWNIVKAGKASCKYQLLSSNPGFNNLKLIMKYNGTADGSLDLRKQPFLLDLPDKLVANISVNPRHPTVMMLYDSSTMKRTMGLKF